MTQKCCVRGCEEVVKESRAKGLPLHKFPKDAASRSKWLTSGGFEPDFKPTSSQIVCYKHFRQSDYELGRSHKLFLKKGSVPSIFKDYENHPDPIGPNSSLITSRLQARENKLSQSLAAAELENLTNCLESSCSSLEASMDSSNSLQASLPKKDSELPAKEEAENSEVDATKDTVNLTPKTLALNDSEVKITPKSVCIVQEQASYSTAPVEEKKEDRPNEPRPNIPNMARGGDLNFLPGCKLEAKDFNDVWYSAKVMETDWIEGEVLIHFDKWSTRYDEWIPMDSSRLRVLQPKETKSKEFVVGEKILATWVDGKKYPAKVTASLGSDKYDVLFDDGYSKVLKTSKMTKLSDAPVNKEEENTYVGSKQERRDKKRKHTITELFQTKKKVKNDPDKNKIPPSAAAGSSKTESESVVEGSLETKQKKTKKDIGKHNVEYEHLSAKLADKSTEEHGTGVDEDYATYIGNLRVEIEDSTYKCPKSGCNKNFRKENLLQMHIKHYHPEYSKFLGSTPNVADLAYARTIGESVEDVLPRKSRLNATASQTHASVLPTSQSADSDFNQSHFDNKTDSKLSLDGSTGALEENSSEPSNSCTMSPGTLFDMRFREERVHTGIKTLPPVRQPVFDDSEQVHSASSLNDYLNCLTTNTKMKENRKRQHYGISTKGGKQNRSAVLEDSYDALDDSAVDGHELSDTTFKLNNASSSRADLDNSDSTQSKNDSIMFINGEYVKVEKLRREEIINCTCGITEEDGLMIQCDLCLCWQHGHCNAIEKETDVPEKYVCYICLHPYRQRPSKAYYHDQGWVQEGKLPSLSSFPADPLKAVEDNAKLKRSYDLLAEILKLQDLLHSLRVKVNIAQSKDHPKLYLWAKNWRKIKIPNFDVKPVPVMEIVKSENISDEYTEDSLKEDPDLSFPTKTEPDQKLITSDTELMKILEEDNSQTDNSKSTSKFPTNNFKDEGRILLDALTRNGLEDQDEAPDKSKSNPNSPSKQNSSNHQDTEKNSTAAKATVSQPVAPEPEAPIDPVECKLRLYEHIDHYLLYVEKVFDYLEMEISALEDSNTNETKIDDAQTKVSMQMLIHDLETIRKFAALF